jgi:hypothetical protein
MTLEQLLKRYPGGFSVSTSGKVYEIVHTTNRLVSMAETHPLPPEGGGYLVVRRTDDTVDVSK